jgi:hypothetical protein
MNWLSLLLCLLAGALVSNAIPHLANGTSGRPFQTPFSRAQRRKSSPVVNVLWGSLNLGLGVVLFSVAGAGWVPATVTAAAVGGVAVALVNAVEFGRSDSDS